MTTLVLHIGTHKTATTSLQSFMKLNARQFGKLGIAVPQMSDYPVIMGSLANSNRNGHFLMYASMADIHPEVLTPDVKKCVLKDIDTFVEVAASNDTVLLSDERIWYEGAYGCDYWKKMLELVQAAGIEDVRIIVYLRRQDQFASSLWRQRIKGRERYPFAAYLRRDALRKALDYNKVLGEMESVFGKQAIVVRVFDRKVFAGGDIYHDFCEAIGIDWNDGFVLPEEELNSSLSNAVAEVKRWANANHAYRNSSNFLRKPAMHVSEMNTSNVESSIWTQERYEKFRKRHKSGNDAIAERYLDGQGGSLTEWPEFDEEKWAAPTGQELQAAVRMFAEAIANQEREISHLKKRLDKQDRKIKKMKQERSWAANKTSNNVVSRKLRALRRRIGLS